MDYEMGNHNCHDMTTLNKTNLGKDPGVNACTELQLSRDIAIRVNKSLGLIRRSFTFLTWNG